jgi:hypothetical protein
MILARMAFLLGWRQLRRFAYTTKTAPLKVVIVRRRTGRLRRLESR